MTRACLVDTTRCIGCRACQVACKQSNDLQAEETSLLRGKGYENPSGFSPYTRTFVSFHELGGDGGNGDSGASRWVFVKRQCMHCREMRCNDVCAPRLFESDPSGAVTAKADQCIGCCACTDECPFGVPTIDLWTVDTPHLRKCSFCLDRQETDLDRLNIGGRRLSRKAQSQYLSSFQTPACVKACPSDALRFGKREALLAEARRRIGQSPNRYVDHIYGEKELGGLGWLYLAGVPFEQLGFPTRFASRARFDDLGREGRSTTTGSPLQATAGTLVAGVCWFFQRRDKLR